MSAPVANPDSGYLSNSQTPGPNSTAHTEPVAEPQHDSITTEPSTSSNSDKDSSQNEKNEKHIYEEEEEVEPHSPADDEPDFKKELRVHPRLDRTNTNYTTTTGGTSMASESVLEAGEGSESTTTKKKRSWNPLKRRIPPPVPSERTQSRETDAGFFSLLTFQWMAPLMDVGFNRPLELNDIWSVNPRRGVDVMKAKMEAAYAKRKETKNKRPLLMALYDTYRGEFLFSGACQLVAALLQVLTPYVMKYLIAFASLSFEAEKGLAVAPPIGHGVGYVFGITVMQIIQSVTTNHFIYRGMMIGGQARSTLISMIFEKSMKLSGRARAGGKADIEDEPKPDFKPGSKEEKAWMEKQLENHNGVSGDGVGWSNGRIVNLMSTDTYRVDQASGLFHMTWTAPIQVLLTLALLLINLRESALSGFAFICIMMPLLGRAIKSLMMRRKFINKITDQRVTLTQEIISSVRFVKYFGWETSFLERLGEIRTRETNKITKLLSIRNAILAVSLSLPIFAAMLAFITYTLSGHNLNPAPIFSSLALFNSLRIPLNLLPMVIGQVVDANASIGRIQEFFEAEELENEADWEPSAKNAIEIDQADFTWERTRTQEADQIPGHGPKGAKQLKQEKKEAKAKAKSKQQKIALKQRLQQEKAGLDSSSPEGSSSPESNSLKDEKPETPFAINDINLTIGRDELVAVIGSVGSGKSSLLAALAGDMRKTSGKVVLGASRAFCPQYAWIQNASVKENIIFGKDYNRKWYNEVVDACALRPDLEMLPAGDMTEIGERGITVSGGQKQRLNIARAIYFNADIVIMDDPLSAVDAHVGKHIMDEAICGLLKGKARVLATHQLHVLHRADRIVWMKDGRIAKIATFPDLMANDKEFQALMETTSKENKQEEQEEVIEDEVAKEKKEVKRKTKKANKKTVALMQQEERAVNSVSSGVYLAYIRASGSLLVAPLILLLLVLSQGANIASSLWLSFWTRNPPFHNISQGTFIGVYAALGVCQAFFTFAFATTLTYYGTRASKVMLHRAIYRVLRAPMSFFDTTPMGRITNRFSKDVDTMDNTLTDSIRMFTLTFVTIFSVFVLIIAYYYFFIVALVPLIFMFLFSAGYYRASARELKRHEAVLRSVVFARFGEAVNGISTIRAYGVEPHFAKTVNASLDSMDGAYFLTFANQRWLSIRLDAVGNLLVFTCGILVVTGRRTINPSTGGLVLSYILSIVMMIQFSVRQLAEVENNMNSTERIHYYGTALEEEAPLHLEPVRESWPEHGQITFDNVQMRYRDGLPLVLKGLDMEVRAGERIGIVGRTGAGKSTIMSTLFRLVELSGGSISIDGVDISKIGLADLRSRLAIIPQDPTLFRGTIRSNLDPFQQHTDLELWNALRQADLVSADQKFDENTSSSKNTSIVGDGAAPASTGRIHLDTPVDDEGLNFSLGQRQLLALARALVRGSQIIVCDEATSSVDFETDQKIQQTIVRGFKGKTLLCIAHRLRTIIGYDRILVMDQGNVAELDTPLRLYEREDGIFRGMCERSGIRREDFFESPEAKFADE